MSNIKKIIGVVLALVMALSVATVAFAATGDKYSVSISADKTTLAAGETATVTVSVTSNYYVSTMSIPVFFDKNLVTVSDASTTLSGDLKDIKVVTDGDLSKFYKGTTYTADDHGVVALTYVAKEGASIDTYNNTAVMTFKVTALADVTGNAVVECVSGTVKTSANTNGTLYLGKNSSGNATVDSLAEWIDDADITAATVSIAIGGGAVEAADLALTDAGATAGVIIDTHKTFGGQYAGVVYGFTQAAANTFITNRYLSTNLQATNEGTLEFARPNGKTSGGFGTGTTVTVKNSDSTVSKTYVVVIFGDVNQDGMITAADTTIVKGWATKPATAPANNTVLRMAANTACVKNATVLHNIQTNDTTALKNYVIKNASATTDVLKLNPVSLANAQNGYNTFYQ